MIVHLALLQWIWQVPKPRSLHPPFYLALGSCALQQEQGDSIKQPHGMPGLDLVSSPKPQIWFVCFGRGLLRCPALC